VIIQNILKTLKLKKLYKYDNGKQIWRILPTLHKKVVIEERDPKKREVFFSCINIESGKKIFSDFQLDEKSWIGIEAIYNDMIFFHSYGKPDMPAHKNIIAFDILSQTIIWQNDKYIFSFVYEDKVYCYQQRFESRVFFALDYLTGNVVEDFGNDVITLNLLKGNADNELSKLNYLYPEYFDRSDLAASDFQKYLQQFLTDNVIKGEISYLKFSDLLLFNYHEISKANTINNIFIAIDLNQNKILLKETLDKNLVNLMPESFFVKDDFLFLIVDKTKLFVYQIKE
jgi:hypothetical protein